MLADIHIDLYKLIKENRYQTCIELLYACTEMVRSYKKNNLTRKWCEHFLATCN